MDLPYCSNSSASTSSSDHSKYSKKSDRTKGTNPSGHFRPSRTHCRLPRVGTVLSPFLLPNLPLLPFCCFFLLSIPSSFIDARLLDTSVACDQHNFLLSLNFDLPFRVKIKFANLSNSLPSSKGPRVQRGGLPELCVRQRDDAVPRQLSPEGRPFFVDSIEL